MRKKKDWKPSATFIAAFSAVCVLGAACHFDALIGSGRKGGGGGGGGGGPSGLETLVQLRSDATTPIPVGGTTPEQSIVVRAVVQDTALTRVVEVEVQPVGTDFQGQPTDRSGPTPRGEPAVIQVAGLQDNTGYHWQARVQGDTTWHPYGGNPESAPDVRVALPVALNRLTFTQPPTTTTAGVAMPSVAVALVDGQGNTLRNFTGNVHLDIAPGTNPGGAALGGQKDVNASGGVATFSGLTITTAGSGYRLEATADGLAAVASGSFGINPGPGNHPHFLVQPSNTTPNRAITPPVQLAILDVYNNVATSYNYVVWCLMANDGSPGKNATLAPSGTGRAPNAGIATYEDLKIDQVGVGYTLTCAGTGIHPEISAPFDVTQ
ncbi:MAG: hypothetical protein DMD60_08110 [Gemmatimonadetes bacterium]|nr:MAG: hypothetical protein DMD60_08110 [Gemmatimonadota bacterium]